MKETLPPVQKNLSKIALRSWLKLSLLVLQAVRPNGTEGEWVSLNVTNLVTDWYKKPKDNLGIVIDATPNTDHQSPIILPTHNSEKFDDWVSVHFIHQEALSLS